MKYLNDAWQSLQLITVMDIIDVLIVAVLVYKLLRVIRHTNAEKLFKGIVVVLVATMLANAAELNEISFLLNQLMVDRAHCDRHHLPAGAAQNVGAVRAQQAALFPPGQ